jgi:hypothetical protein
MQRQPGRISNSAALKLWLSPWGGEVREGAGSRVMLEISGKREYAHRPHPGKEAKRYIVERIREWLISLEVTP